MSWFSFKSLTQRLVSAKRLSRQKRRARRKKVHYSRPRFEVLEDRIMLDAGLPAALAVGKTLSAYSVADIQDQKEIITYTVYNQQADPVHGVLLTDTLQPGVTFQNASQLPDQSGQDLAWSLGDIPGFGRASVSLTVSLADSLSLQLDSVTRAFATLNAQMVTAEAPASLLRPYAIPGDLLASTPDANITDPFIQQKAAELGYDPQRIFDYLDNEIGYNSYNGSLRGARGTLWSSAGNALDVASLGVALMRASGIPAQYVSGTLSHGQAQELILSMFPASFQTVGYIPEGTEVADPANDPKLLAETVNHYWFQFDIGNGMQDADPLMPGRTLLGQTFTTSMGTFTEVPDELREKTRVQLTAEVYYQSDAAFGLDPFHRTVVLDQTFNDVDLVGRPLSIGNFVNTSEVGSPVFGVVTNTYSPYIILGDEAFPSSQAETVRGTDYQEQLTNFPLGSQILTGLFLDVRCIGPNGLAETFDRALVDRVGYAVRMGLVNTSVGVDLSAAAVITPFDMYTLNVLPGLQNPGVPSTLLDRLPSQVNTAEASLTDGALTPPLVTFSQAQSSIFSAMSDRLQGNIGSVTSVLAYFDRPRITMFSTQLITNGDQMDLVTRLDLIRDSARALASPGQNVQAEFTFASTRGLLDTVLEERVLAATGSQVVSETTILNESIQQGIPLATLSAENSAQLQGFDLPAEAKARIVTAIQNGFTVIVPTQSVTISGIQMTAWFELNPQTGEMLGTMQNGGHSPLGDLSKTINGISLRALAYAEKPKFVLTFVVVATGAIVFAKAQHLQGTDELVDFVEAMVRNDPKLRPFIPTLNRLKELAKDPPLQPFKSNLQAPFPDTPTNPATVETQMSIGIAQGAIVGSDQVGWLTVSKQLEVSWTTATGSSFQAQAINVPAGTVAKSDGGFVGPGAIAIAATADLSVSISGSNHYAANGTGSLSFYGPAETNLGVSGNWNNYMASVTGNVTITLTTDSLMLNGNLLPAGTYTITTNAATLSGSGLTTSPNFSGSVSIDATDATINLGPGTGDITVGGSPLDPTNGITLTGYTGNITIAGNATNLDDVTLAGNAADVLTVTATPAALTTDQNTPVTFQTNVNTSFADTYNITVQAPTGWTVTIDDTGNVTATPAPGLQDGTYAIQIIAQSTTNPELVAQTTVQVAITPTLAGMTLAVNHDPIFTVPFNDAQVPTAYQVVIHNDGPTADTFNLSFANIPAGFTLLNSGTSVTIPAGETGIVGVYLQATTTLPAPGTPLSFDVTATSTSNPAITQSFTKSFTMPVVDGVTLAADPPQVATTPGGSTTTTLTLHNVGNVPETVTLIATGSADVTVSGLDPVTLDVGQTVTVTITLTAAETAALNSTLLTTITASYGATVAPQPTTTSVALLVRSPETVAISQAAIAAAQVPNFQLAATLSDLADAVSQLPTAPGDAALLGRVQFLLPNLSTLLSADPALTSHVTALQPLQASASAGDVAGLLAQAPAYFSSLASTLAVEATQKFTVNLSSTLIDAEPGQSKDITVQLVNTGADPVTLDLSASGLPSNVTASFSESQVTLPAGATQTITVTLANTLVSAKVFTLEITAAASVVRHTATTAVAIRPAVADVLAVTVNPTAVDPGDSVAVTALVFNAANVARSVLAHVDILDLAGDVVSTPAEAPFSLVPGSGNVTLDLGQVSTTELAIGFYYLRLSLRASDGSSLPGQSSQAFFSVGQPITASVTASPTIVAPGTSTVSTTITVSNQTGSSGIYPPGLIHLWKGDGNALDTVGDNPGTLQGGVTFASGISDQAFSLDGNSAWVDFGNTVGNFGASDFTIDLWLKTDSTAVLQEILSKRTHCFHDNMIDIRLLFGQVVIELDQDTNGTNYNQFFSNKTVNDGQFHRITLVRHGTTALLYIDGELDSTNSTSAVTIIDNSASFLVGSGPCVVGGPPPGLPNGDGTLFFDGLLDELAMYNRALSATEIQGSTGDPVNLVTNGDFSAGKTGFTTDYPLPGDDSALMIVDYTPEGYNPYWVSYGDHTTGDGLMLIINGASSPNRVVWQQTVSIPQPGRYQIEAFARSLTIFHDNPSTLRFLVNGQQVGTNFQLPSLTDYWQAFRADWDSGASTTATLTIIDDNLAYSGNDFSLDDLSFRLVANPTVSVDVVDILPGSGYVVDPETINPTANSVSASQVAWKAANVGGTSVYQLTGTVNDMAPGEVRQISLGSTVTATEIPAPAPLSVRASGDPGHTADDDFDIANGITVTSHTPLNGDFIPAMDIRDLFGGEFTGINRFSGENARGTITFLDRAPQQVDTVTFTTPSPVTISGYRLYLGGGGDGSRSATNFALMVGNVTVSSVSIIPAGSSYRATYGSDVIEVSDTFAPVTGSTFTAIFIANTTSFAGPRVYELDAITPVSATLSLPALTVAAEHIISLQQATQTADRGAESSYTVQVKNPYATDQTYLLSSDGLGGLANNLPSSVLVPAGQTVSVPLNVAVPPGMTPGVHVFQVFATTEQGAVDSVEGQLTVSPEVVLNSQAVHIALQQSEGSAGQGTPAIYTLRITNEGNAVDTYNLSALVPAGVTATFSQQSVTVPPGQSNFRDVTVTLTPAIGATPGTYPFEVSVASVTNPSIMATAGGMLEVLASGVSVALTPGSDAPGSTFQMTVTNTGQVADTFDLALAGPAFFVASLGTTTVSLAPGESQVFPITTGAVTFAVPGALALTALATSQANPAVRAAATANLSIATTQGMTAEFSPASVSVQQVGPTSFLLLVHNTGNTEDAYTATITGTSGPITASLTGLEGQPTQTIPIFRLPGLFTGAIVLQTEVVGPGQGTVTVQVQSLDNPVIIASATATVNAVFVPTVTVTGGAFIYDAQPHPASGMVTGFNGANLGTPNISYTDADNVTTSSPPVNSGTHTVTASFPANGDYSAASSTAMLVIDPATPTVVVTAAGGTYNGSAFAASATVTGVGGDGTLASSPDESLTFTYYVGSSASGAGASTAPVDPGTYTVVAHYAGSSNYSGADSAALTFTINEATAISVNIDIKPGSDTNPINLANNGVIPVAVYGSSTFDVTQVDIASIVFAGAHVAHYSLEDVNGDGFLDLTLHFRTQDTQLRALYEALLAAADTNTDGALDAGVSALQSTELLLTGKTTAGEEFQGSDLADVFLSGKNLRDFLALLAIRGEI